MYLCVGNQSHLGEQAERLDIFPSDDPTSEKICYPRESLGYKEEKVKLGLLK